MMSRWLLALPAFVCSCALLAGGPTSPNSVSPSFEERLSGERATRERAARKLAVGDLRCEEREVTVEEFSSEYYRALGCGQVALYRCSGGPAGGTMLPRCEREFQTRSDAGPE